MPLHRFPPDSLLALTSSTLQIQGFPLHGSNVVFRDCRFSRQMLDCANFTWRCLPDPPAAVICNNVCSKEEISFWCSMPWAPRWWGGLEYLPEQLVSHDPGHCHQHYIAGQDSFLKTTRNILPICTFRYCISETTAEPAFEPTFLWLVRDTHLFGLADCVFTCLPKKPAKSNGVDCRREHQPPTHW